MLVIPISSKLHNIITELVQTKRMIFITGLPGVGKSLMIQQTAIIADQLGRNVNLLQWDVTRRAFETPENLAKYPELNGVTDPAIRKAAGLWARKAVFGWHQTHPNKADILIGELPIIGSRLLELVESQDDSAEALLRSSDVEFIVPVPSWDVREVIEDARAETIAHPRNEKEKRDASPAVLRALWQEVNGLARKIKLTKARHDAPYNPYIYGGVYEALLRHRHHKLLLIDNILRPKRSVYDLDIVANVLEATPEEADFYMSQVESEFTAETLEAAMMSWHTIITNDPKQHDKGAALQLPLPHVLPGIEQRTEFSAEQKQALTTIQTLPLNATPQIVCQSLKNALATFPAHTDQTTDSDVAKFDIYDSYFNVTRSGESEGQHFIKGFLQSYCNVLEDMQAQPHSLSVVEMPMLRIALETTLNLFNLETAEETPC